MAKHKRPQYLHVYKDRHGTERIYFNRPGFPKVALPCPLYSEEFWTAYHKAKAGTLPKPMEIGAARTIPGSMSDLIGKYFKAPEFKSLGETTQKVVRRQLDVFREKHGHRPVRGFERKHAKAIIGDMSDRMHEQEDRRDHRPYDRRSGEPLHEGGQSEATLQQGHAGTSGE